MKELKRIRWFPLILSLCIIFAALTLGACSVTSERAAGNTASLGTKEMEAAGETNTLPGADGGENAGSEAGGEDGQDSLTVHFLDVGQGDSILIGQGGRWMLVDAGENDMSDTVVEYLKRRGVKRLEYVIGTHPDSDHIGGLDVVIRTFDIGTVLISPKSHTTQTFEDVLCAIEEKNLKLIKPKVGERYALGRASFQVIAPNGDYGEDNNDWSVGIKLVYGDSSFVMCGDAEAQAEHDICGNGIDISADVLKLGHHGSISSSAEEFLDKVAPAYAVLSCGKDNTYGHPHRETLERISSRGIQVLRTDELGTITAVSDGTEIKWSSEAEDSADKVEQPAGNPSVETTQESLLEDSVYILNTNTMKFHYPSCSSAEQMSEKNREEFTGARDDLLSRGYSPCKLCNP